MDFIKFYQCVSQTLVVCQYEFEKGYFITYTKFELNIYLKLFDITIVFTNN